MSNKEEEDKRYDRQTRLWGIEIQLQIRKSSIYIDEITDPTSEILKNICLAGIGTVYLRTLRLQNVEIGMGNVLTILRGHSLLEKIHSLNPYTQVIALDEVKSREGGGDILPAANILLYQNSSRLRENVFLYVKNKQQQEDRIFPQAWFLIELYGNIARFRRVCDESILHNVHQLHDKLLPPVNLSPNTSPAILEVEFNAITTLLQNQIRKKANPSKDDTLLELIDELGAFFENDHATSYTPSESRLVFLSECILSGLKYEGSESPPSVDGEKESYPFGVECCGVLGGLVVNECIKTIAQQETTQGDMSIRASVNEVSYQKRQASAPENRVTQIGPIYHTILIDATGRCEALVRE